MRRYRNIKNGREIAISSVLTSTVWAEVDAEEPKPKEKAVKQDERTKRVRKHQ